MIDHELEAIESMTFRSILWGTGMWMFWRPYTAKRKRARKNGEAVEPPS